MRFELENSSCDLRAVGAVGHRMACSLDFGDDCLAHKGSRTRLEADSAHGHAERRRHFSFSVDIFPVVQRKGIHAGTDAPGPDTALAPAPACAACLGTDPTAQGNPAWKIVSGRHRCGCRDGGVVLTQAIHSIDLFRALAPGLPETGWALTAGRQLRRLNRWNQVRRLPGPDPRQGPQLRLSYATRYRCHVQADGVQADPVRRHQWKQSSTQPSLRGRRPRCAEERRDHAPGDVTAGVLRMPVRWHLQTPVLFINGSNGRLTPLT